MKSFKKTALALAGLLTVSTSIVGLKNAIDAESDETIGHKQGFYEKYIKRPQDFFCASAATMVLSPVLAGTAFMVKKKLGSPVLFRQDRPGKNGEVFKLYKFRTMTDERDENGEMLSDEQRLTRFGRLLRSTSLDELPELFNIINTRLLNQNNKCLKTIISTNLSLPILNKTYGERITSRLIGNYNICRFFGDDIRFSNR